MVVKKMDSIIAESNSLLDSTVRASGCDAVLTKYRDYRSAPLTFCAELHDGKVRVKGSRVGQDMADHLNQLRTSYNLGPEPASKGQGLRIVDEKSSVFHLQSTPAAAAVLKSSRTLIADPALLASPGRAHLGQISGIQTTVEGDQFRLIRQRLHRFEPQMLTWIADQDTQKYNRIGLTREGLLMKVPQGLGDRSVDGKAQVSLEQSSGALHLQRLGEPEGLRFTPISESGEALQLARIGLAGDVLYATGPAGELLRGDLCTVDGGCLKMRLEPLEELERWHEGSVNFKGFMHDDEGRLNGLLLDRYQQLHSCPLTNRERLLAEWNLSDVLLNFIDNGIPEPAGVVDLGQRGKVALEGSTLLSWDISGQRWDHTDQVDVDRLERGLDSFVYVLQAGQLKALGTQKTQAPVHLGASYDLSAPKTARMDVTLDVLAGDAQRVITGFAVVDGGCFVSLDGTNQLRAHINGKETVLTFAEPKDIQTLALDALGNLYAHSQAGELLKLDKTHWQNTSASELAWTQVVLPDNERLKSLRMGADQHLIASWGENNPQLNRWGEKYRQLNISDQGDLQWQPLTASTRKSATPLSSVLRSGEVKKLTTPVIGPTAWAATTGVIGQKTEGIDRDRDLFKGLRAHIKPIDGLRNMGLDFQHRSQGRAGLEGLYAADKIVREQLKPLANAKPAELDMMSRLELLSRREAVRTVADDLKKALTVLEENSRSSATKLGDLHGARMIPEAAVAGAKRNQKVSYSSLSQMRQAFENQSPSTANATAALLRSYEAQGVVLSKWNPDSLRDLKNPTALVESDLIHHALTLSQLSQLMTRLEGQNPDLPEISQLLEEVMSGYHDNPVHKKVLQNINGYAQAEQLYHNFKLLAKDLGTPGSALNFHISRLLGVSGQEGIKQALIQEIQHAESGQSITSSREKSMGVGLLAYGISALPLLDFSVGVSKSKANAVTITRTDKGADVEINMNATLGGKASAGVGATNFSVDDSLGGGLRTGVELAIAVARDTGASVKFSVKQSDFSKMMTLLTGEGGDVYDLLDIGTEHTTSKSSKNSFDLGVFGLVQGRGHFKVLEGSGELESLVRGVIGVSANLNLIHGERSHSKTQGQNQITRTRGSDLQFFNKGAFTLGAGPINSLTGVRVATGGPALGSATAPDISFSISFDRTVSHAFSFTFKQPSEVTQAKISDLQGAMSRFSVPLKQGLQGLPQANVGIAEQLKKMQDIFENAPVAPTRSEEHFALKNQLQNLLQQQRLVSEGRYTLTSVESTVTYVGLSCDAKHSWMDDAAPANKAAIVEQMKKQQQLAQMLNDLESSTGTSVSIVLEAKPDVLRMIENSVTDTRNARHDVEQALKNPENLRIKSMSVSSKTSRTHGVGLPTPVLSYSSTASLSHSQKVFNAVFEYGANPDIPLVMRRNDSLPSTEKTGLGPEFSEQHIRDGRRPEYSGENIK